MRIRPCIDIHNGAVKQIIGGSLRDQSGAQENFVSARDAAEYAAVYRDMDLPGGHIILLNSVRDAAAYEADRQQALRALRAFPGGMQIGGGITPETAPAYLDAGASHVIVTSYVFRDGQLEEERLEKMIAAVGREHLVLDLSCRRMRSEGEASPAGETAEPTAAVKSGGADGAAGFSGRERARYAVVTDRWQKMTRLQISGRTLTDLSSRCDEFLIHAADVEGRRAGIETELVRLLGAWMAAAPAPIPVTYAGGVRSLDDLTLIRRLSCDLMDVTVGSALDLFGGDLSLSSLVTSAGAPL